MKGRLRLCQHRQPNFPFISNTRSYIFDTHNHTHLYIKHTTWDTFLISVSPPHIKKFPPNCKSKHLLSLTCQFVFYQTTDNSQTSFQTTIRTELYLPNDSNGDSLRYKTYLFHCPSRCACMHHYVQSIHTNTTKHLLFCFVVLVCID
jgi:hypothetical protein